MRKKLFSVLVCACMAVTLLAGCGKKNEDVNNTTPTPAVTATLAPTEAPETQPDTTPATVVGESLPEPVYYYSFDKAAGTDGIVSAMKDAGAITLLNDKAPVFVDGVKGDALYADGVTGYKLTNVKGVGETYTLSFWVNASRFATYMPTVQYGPDIHGDLTGSQHYVNFTRTEWSGEAAFPCVWSYDQADNAKWPNWAPPVGEGEHVKKWVNITFVVDPTKLSEDEELINAQLYVNGVDYGIVPTVFDVMVDSENFEMLLGVNYWDATFKGAFDELYVFNEALTAGQALTLFNSGDPNATFIEPEHVFEFYKEEGAIESLGSESLSSAWLSTYSSATTIADGQTWQVKLHNWSDAKDTKNNYGFIFANAAYGTDGYKEYAVVNADATGTVGGADIAAKEFTYTWGNWNTWSQKVMRDADVTATITRDGSKLIIEASNVDFNESANVMTVTVDTGIAATEPMVFFLSCKDSYVDILSIKNKTASPTGVTIGNTDCTTPFWSAFSNIWSVPVGESKTVSFTNYTDGVNNWDNFLVVLQNTPNGHAADQAEGYAEYAVLRADNWGWGAGYDGIAVAENNWDFDNFTSIMDGIKVYLTVTNNGATADVVATCTTPGGKIYTQKYTGIATGGDLYFCLTCEAAYLELDTKVVGNTDCTTPFWSDFSDIWAVPAGQKKTVSFVNHTDGVNNWDNFLAVLQNTPAGHSADAFEGYAEYAVVRADNYGWGAGYDGIANPVCDWNWDTFKSDLDGAQVNLTVVNNGTTADILSTIVTADGKTYHQNYIGIAVSGDLYFCLTCEASYLSIDTVGVGNVDCTTGFWTKFSDIYAVPQGATKYVSFTNNTDGVNNWDNFLVILQNTPAGHSAADVEGYAEYAVLRADNYGWGAGFDGIVAPESNWNWDSFTADMDKARVTLAITNNGATADVIAYVTSASGKVYTQKYAGIATGGDLYFCLSCEAAYLTID